MIKRVKINNLRGKSFDLELGRLSLVIGANTAGKTTMADAIRWGLLGYIPGMDKPPRGWAELVGEGESIATVQLDLDGGSLGRTISLERTSAKVDGWVDEGADLVNVLGLDPAKFLEATGPEQAQMLADATQSSFDWHELVPTHLRDIEHKYWHDKWSVWIEATLGACKDTRTFLAGTKKTLAATLRGLESLREIVIEDDATIKAKLDEGKEKLGALREQLRAVTIQIANVKDAPTAQGQLDVVLRALQEFMGQNHDEESLNDRWKDLGQRIKDYEKQKPKTDLDQLRVTATDVQASASLAQARLERLAMDAKALEGKYKELKRLKRCPTCGSHGAGLTEAIKLAENAETRRLADEVKAATKDLEKAQAKLTAATKGLEEAEAYQTEGLKLDDERQKLEDEQQLIALWKRHDELVAAVSEQSQQFDIQGLQQRRYDIECEMQEQEEMNAQSETELATVNYKRGQKKQLEQVEQELNKAEILWEQENQKVKELEQLRDRLSAMSLEPILSTLAMFTKGIFAEPLSLERAELGRLVGGRWVPLNQFSGSEQAVAVVALSCALRGDPEHKNLVLADELSAFDNEHLAVFLGNVAAAIKAGVLDQFIGFTTPRKLDKSFTKEMLTKAGVSTATI